MNEMTPIWHQTYLLFGPGLGVSTLLAALPIFTLLLLLGVLRKAAWIAGIAGLVVALALAIIGYGMPAKAAVSTAVYGEAFGLFPISWIIFWAIALFRVTVETGKFEIIRDSIGSLTPDPRLQGRCCMDRVKVGAFPFPLWVTPRFSDGGRSPGGPRRACG
jgi:lactate permease